MGDAEAGLALVEETLEFIRELHEALGDDTYGMRTPDAQIVQGDLLRILPTPDEEGAEACYREAIRISKHQDAKLPNLTAATHLARLLADRGDTQEALRTLEPIYASFNEGLDTIPLEDARRVLRELGSRHQ